ncbi:arabinanase/levansucrase/invertase [Actinidia rufa]|uniref:Arabinanase/levansucrase/invertase n=1 Tax=Actinidia rufa TaxID=165716 RepID=A0A7J0HFT3_9ERIC|nr:arabinanase/levansucrase/invertase [Actinidia rufa]
MVVLGGGKRVGQMLWLGGTGGVVIHGGGRLGADGGGFGADGGGLGRGRGVRDREKGGVVHGGGEFGVDGGGFDVSGGGRRREPWAWVIVREMGHYERERGRSKESPGSDSVGVAVSSNGVHWERGGGPVQSGEDTGLVMNCSKDWWAFDRHSIRPCVVVIMSSAKVRANNAVYWLYYTGFSSEKVSLGIILLNSCPMSPILTHSQTRKRLENITTTSSVTGMYYHSFDVENGVFAVGIARSRDGIKWVKLGKIIGGGGNGASDEFGALNPRVVRNRKDGKYLMVYEGVGAGGQRSIGLAMSTDGLKNWERVQGGTVLKPSEEDGWDNKEVGSPCLVQMDGNIDEWRLYYRGIGERGEVGIGMPVCLKEER